MDVFSAFSIISQTMEALCRESAKVAEAFVNRYYGSMDTSRHKIHMLYSTNARIIWNGNCIEGNEKIAQFFTERIPSSSFMIEAYDSFPLNEASENSSGQTAAHLNGGIQLSKISVSVTGSVKYKSNPSRGFQHTFVMSIEQFNWKIESESFRFSD